MKIKQVNEFPVTVFNDHKKCVQFQQGNDLVNIERENIDKLIGILQKSKAKKC